MYGAITAAILRDMAIMENPPSALTDEGLSRLSLLIALDLADLTDDFDAIQKETDPLIKSEINVELRAYKKSAKIYDEALNRYNRQSTLSLEDKNEVERLRDLMRRIHTTILKISEIKSL